MNEVVYHRFVAVIEDQVLECVDCGAMVVVEELIEGEVVAATSELLE